MNERNVQLLKPRLGLGTWRYGFEADSRQKEIAAVQAAVDLGVTVIDTAEMYASGGAEDVVGEAIESIRDKVYLVTKVTPSNASYEGTIAACERSLRRLRTDFIDLYLLHWIGSHPWSETIAAFENLRERGLIGEWGVSNFDADDMAELWTRENGANCAANQVYYSLGVRGVEFDLLPWQKQNGVATMAYCPLDQGRLVSDERVRPIADKHNVTIAQVALAWMMLQPEVIPIPKSSSVARVTENAAARDIVLDAEDIALLDGIFPAPTGKTPLKTT